MQLTTENKKRRQTYLSNEQKWAVASFCVENRNVIQDIDPREKIDAAALYPYSIWRVKQAQTAKEINDAGILIIPITAYHVGNSIDFFNEISELTGKFPEPKPIQETVEMDQLKIENVRLKADIQEITNNYTKLTADNIKLYSTLDSYKQLFNSISKLVPADCFALKKK